MNTATPFIPFTFCVDEFQFRRFHESRLLRAVTHFDIINSLNRNLTKECDCMTGLHLIVLIFSALTLHFTYGAYKQNRFPKKAFTLVSIMEAVVIVATAVMLIMSF